MHCLTKSGPRCPTCREALTVDTVKPASRVIVSLLEELEVQCSDNTKVECQIASGSCEWVGPISELRSHIGDCSHVSSEWKEFIKRDQLLNKVKKEWEEAKRNRQSTNTSYSHSNSHGHSYSHSHIHNHSSPDATHAFISKLSEFSVSAAYVLICFHLLTYGIGLLGFAYYLAHYLVFFGSTLAIGLPMNFVHFTDRTFWLPLGGLVALEAVAWYHIFGLESMYVYLCSVLFAPMHVMFTGECENQCAIGMAHWGFWYVKTKFAFFSQIVLIK